MWWGVEGNQNDHDLFNGPLLVVLGTCFLRKYVFDAYEGVRCRNYHRGTSQRWKIPRRNHLMVNWLFQFLARYQGGKSNFYAIFMAFAIC